MKNSIKWLVVLLTSSSFAFADCLEVEVKGEKVCYTQASAQYLSKGCASVADCFPFSGKFRVVPDQSPGFTMCYDLGGKPFFEKVRGEKRSTPFCRKDGRTVDINSLLRTYGPRAQKR